MRLNLLIISLFFISSGIVAQNNLGLHIENQTVLFGQDTTSIGLKTMWLASKGAFRSGNMTSAWNYSSIGNISTAFGSDTQALGNYSFAAGLGTNANSFAEFSIGQYSLFGGDPLSWEVDGADVVFEIGNGITSGARSNLLTVQKSGNVKIGDKTDPAETIDEKLMVDGSIVIGQNSAQIPVRGTIRFNKYNNDFEGWNGTEWKSLTSDNLQPNLDQWIEYCELFAGDAFDRFGSNVDMDNEILVIGAEGTDISNIENQGKVYVFERGMNCWVLLAELTSSDGHADSEFGSSVSIDGDQIVVGARGQNVGSHVNQGSVYVFVKPQDGWINTTETAKLSLSAIYEGQHGLFGRTVDNSGDVIIAGNNYQVFVFEKPSGGWIDMTETALLSSQEDVFLDRFGHSISISNDVIIVGAPHRDMSLPNFSYSNQQSGKVFLFEKPQGGWVDMTETAELLVSGGNAMNQFGISVQI